MYFATFGLSHVFAEADKEGNPIDYHHSFTDDGRPNTFHTFSETTYAGKVAGGSYFQQGISFSIDRETGSLLSVDIFDRESRVENPLLSPIISLTPEGRTGGSTLLIKDQETGDMKDAMNINKLYISSSARSPYLRSLGKGNVQIGTIEGEVPGAYVKPRPDMKVVAAELTKSYISGIAGDDPDKIQSLLDKIPHSILESLGVEPTPQGIMTFEPPFNPAYIKAPPLPLGMAPR